MKSVKVPFSDKIDKYKAAINDAERQLREAEKNVISAQSKLHRQLTFEVAVFKKTLPKKTKDGIRISGWLLTYCNTLRPIFVGWYYDTAYNKWVQSTTDSLSGARESLKKKNEWKAEKQKIKKNVIEINNVKNTIVRVNGKNFRLVKVK